MSDERLWAPWRLDYIKSPDRNDPADSKPPNGCFLCDYVADPAADAGHHVVRRTETAIAVLNRFPYNNGHLLVAPAAHRGDLAELNDGEASELMRLVTDLTGVLRERLNAQGFNVGLNLGAVAGAGLPGHLHWHVVPRWAGDTNFMAAAGGPRVIPQSLDAVHALLTEPPAAAADGGPD